MKYTIEQIEKMLNETTPGEWSQRGCWVHIEEEYAEEDYGFGEMLTRSDKDAEFIAASKSIIRQLLDEREVLERQNDEMRKDILEMLPSATKGGMAYYLCLNCGMPTYRGVSRCSLCPLDNAKRLMEGGK